jgi:hypothetical protein
VPGAFAQSGAWSDSLAIESNHSPVLFMIEQDCSYSRLTLISAQPVPPLTELPITWALADPKIDERHVLIAAPEHDPPLARSLTAYEH